MEFYYTGRQSLADNPYRTSGRSYVSIGFLAERRFGWWRAFVNAENLGNVRQTRWDRSFDRRLVDEGAGRRMRGRRWTAE